MRTAVTSVDWATYPILDIADAPETDRRRADRPAGYRAAGAGEPRRARYPRRSRTRSSMRPACGCAVPLTPERMKAALARA